MKFKSKKRRLGSKPKKTEYQLLKERTWRKFSAALRMSHAIKATGYAQCVTCGKWSHWKKMQAGHYIPRGQGLAMLFEPHNVHCQCPRCNLTPEETDEQGRDVKARYREFIRVTYGDDEHDRLIRLKNRGRDKFTIPELEDMLTEYEAIIEVEEERLMTLY